MSSLCCAIATPDRSLPCHRCAILGISSLFHANASEAKPCRCESLRCTTFPSQITSALFSAIPSPRCSSPFLRVAMICSAFALPVCASQCRCVAVGCATLPLHSSSPHSLRLCISTNCFASPCLGSASLHSSVALDFTATHSLCCTLLRTFPCYFRCALPLQSVSMPCFAVAGLIGAFPSPVKSLRCHALALRHSTS